MFTAKFHKAVLTLTDDVNDTEVEKISDFFSFCRSMSKTVHGGPRYC